MKNLFFFCAAILHVWLAFLHQAKFAYVLFGIIALGRRGAQARRVLRLLFTPLNMADTGSTAGLCFCAGIHAGGDTLFAAQAFCASTTRRSPP
ncbi:hypothetical protein NM961_21530 [Tahibacter sp. P2K]|uniref:Uncharacterized protein n=1 Tax=Tahibacter harae TaxID=2963937 RepID=A0ABT1QYD2_9GAMM|nr:hypothetical protein [Tahibacter harae]